MLVNLESRFVTWKYILGHSGDLWSEDRLMGLACSHAWKPVKTRRRGWPDLLFRRTFKLKAFLFIAFDLPWHAVKTILWYQSLGLCSDQTKHKFQQNFCLYFWRNIAVLPLPHSRTCFRMRPVRWEAAWLLPFLLSKDPKILKSK